MYFEICAAMGTEPIEDEIPVEFDDFYNEVQEAFIIYNKLKDEWDTFNGVYLGKNYTGIKDIFEILEVPKEDWKTMFDIINIIDGFRAESISKLKKSQTKTPG